MSKALALMLFALLVLSSLVMVGSVSTQSIPKPSVPEFTLEFVDNSYDVPSTYEIDPYTGENITYPGYHVKRITLEVKIRNQPFVPYYDAESGWDISFYYNIRIKGFYSEDWIELYRPSDGYPTQSESEYTVISLGTLGETGLSLLTNAKMIDVPSGGEVDFQVEAMIGYVHRSGEPPWFPWTFYGETSLWSNTQTISIPEIQTPSPEPTPTPEPTIPTSPSQMPDEEPELAEQEIILGVAVTIAIVGVGLGLLFYLIRRK